MREGAVAFIDDATPVPPSVLAVVYPAMETDYELAAQLEIDRP